MSNLIKIGIDPSGTGTTAIAIFENNKLIEKKEFTNKKWTEHWIFINSFLDNYPKAELFVEDCYFTSANGSKDRDDLLRLLGVLEVNLIFTSVAPKYTKNIANRIEYKSKFLKNNPHLNDNFGDIKIGWEKDSKLYYEYGKGWKYNNEKISNHLRDAIIIANYEN